MRVRVGEVSPVGARVDVEAEVVPWRLGTPRGRESCRWQACDGRWVALTLGQDEELGQVVVSNSDGRRELVDSYEGALTLARSWRTSR